MPTSVTNLTEAYISPSTYLNKRDIRKTIFDRYNEHNLFDFMFHTGRKSVTDNTTFHWHEFDYLYRTVTVAAGGLAGGATAGAVATVTEDKTGAEDAAYASSKVGDVWLANGVRAYVTAVTPQPGDEFDYTIKPVNSADTLATPYAAGTVIAVFSNAKADGTGQPNGLKRKPVKYDNDTQIFATQDSTNGSVAANKAEVEVEGKPYYYIQGIVDAANKHNLDIEYQLLLGERAVGLTDADGEPVYMTRGLEKYIEDFGNDETYTTLAMSDLEAIEKINSRERAGKNMMMLNGINLNLAVNDFLKGKMDNNGIDYSAFGRGNGKQRAIDFGFDSFRFNNRTYHIKECEALDYKPVTGSGVTNSPYPDMGFVIPMDKIKNPNPKNGLGGTLDAISIRFKKNDRYDRYIQHWVRDHKITNEDKVEFNHLSELGLMFVGANAATRLLK